MFVLLVVLFTTVEPDGKSGSTGGEQFTILTWLFLPLRVLKVLRQVGQTLGLTPSQWRSL
jgi:hypothetical protein